MRVAVGMVAGSALAGSTVWAQEEAAGQYRTAVSVTGGLSVGSTGSPHLGLDRIVRGFGNDDGASLTVGGSIAHDLTPAPHPRGQPGAYQGTVGQAPGARTRDCG